jgi:hypothetical protein
VPLNESFLDWWIRQSTFSTEVRTASDQHPAA